MSMINMQDRSYGNAVHNSTSQVASPLDLLGDQSWQQPTDELHLMDAGAQTLDCDSGAFSLADNFVDLDDLADRETASLDMLTPAERRAQSNRLAQRRARARRKAKAVGTEAQLAVTSAELQELQSKQRALEARNSLLEKIVRLNHTPQRPEGQASSAVLAHANCFRQLLDRLSEEDDSQARQRLNSLTLEFQTFVLVIPLLYPSKMKVFGSCKMDSGIVCSDIPHDQKPGLDDPGILVVLQHTASQKADLLFLRRRFFGKIKQLASQRSSLMQRMSNIEAEHLRDGERHEKLAELSAQLKQNGQEDYRTHIHFTAVMYEGIHTPQQWASAIVYYYPYIPRHKRWPEFLAAQEGEPSIGELMTDDSISDTQHDANWQMILDYLSNLTLEQKAYHVPLPR